MMLCDVVQFHVMFLCFVMLCYVMLFYVTSYNSTEVNKKVDIKRVGIVIRMTLVLFLVLITRLGRVNA